MWLTWNKFDVPEGPVVQQRMSGWKKISPYLHPQTNLELVHMYQEENMLQAASSCNNPFYDGHLLPLPPLTGSDEDSAQVNHTTPENMFTGYMVSDSQFSNNINLTLSCRCQLGYPS